MEKLRLQKGKVFGFLEIFIQILKHQNLKAFFDALVCEDGFDESQFDEDLLDENNWYVCENGKIIGISYPAIYDDSEIGFR